MVSKAKALHYPFYKRALLRTLVWQVEVNWNIKCVKHSDTANIAMPMDNTGNHSKTCLAYMLRNGSTAASIHVSLQEKNRPRHRLTKCVREQKVLQKKLRNAATKGQECASDNLLIKDAESNCMLVGQQSPSLDKRRSFAFALHLLVANVT